MSVPTQEAIQRSKTPHIVKLMIEDLKDDDDAQRLESHLSELQDVVYSLAKERDELRAELARTDALHDELKRVHGNTVQEVERLRAFVREVNEADTEGYFIYVEEQDTGYLVSDPDEAIDDLTNHNAETLELIVRPRRMEGV